jgi:putative transposase
MPRSKRSVMKIGRNSKGKRRVREEFAASPQCVDLDTRVEMIQTLIPLGLEAVRDVLQQEVTRLAGSRYQRHGGLPGHVRWGEQTGWVYLGDQKVNLSVPRVRNQRSDSEVRLDSYEQLQEPKHANDLAMGRLLKGLSCRDYQTCVDQVPETFGLSASTLSRRFKQATAEQLAQLNERDLSEYDFVAILLDGKKFAEDEMVIALGITKDGSKMVLGFVQTATENARVCGAFLQKLVDRGLSAEEGLLFVIDGAKGLRAAVRQVFGDHGLVQRCMWHKRENVVGHLTKRKRATYRKKLQQAYEKKSHSEAKAALKEILEELSVINQDAAGSLEEGLEETLTLHRLGLFGRLGKSLKTTNCIENLNSLVGQRTDKVDYWVNSEQKHRWLAAAIRDIEPRFHRIQGYSAIPQLQAMLAKQLGLDQKKAA